MDSTTRLDVAQAELVQAGYVDLKFFFQLGFEQVAKSDVQQNLATSLENFLNKEYKTSSFNDADLIA